MNRGWRPTHAQVRALGLSAVLLVVAVLFRRPDAAVLGLPLAILALWGTVTRPAGEPVAKASLDASTLFEGQVTTYWITVSGVDPRADLLVAAMPRGTGSPTTPSVPPARS